MSWPHQFELINLGITDTVHQPAGSSIELGVRGRRATRMAPAFILLDRTATTLIAAVLKNETAFISPVRPSITDVEDQFAEGRVRPDFSVDVT